MQHLDRKAQKIKFKYSMCQSGKNNLNQQNRQYIYTNKKKAEKISHIHLSQVLQSDFNAKVNMLTFEKLHNNFFCFQLYTMINYNIRL